MFALEGIQANCELNYCVCTFDSYSGGIRLSTPDSYSDGIRLGKCQRVRATCTCTGVALRHKAIKVAEMASQGADSIPSSPALLGVGSLLVGFIPHY